MQGLQGICFHYTNFQPRMTTYLRVTADLERGGRLRFEILLDHFFAPVKRGEVRPVYEYRLPVEMEHLTLNELAAWYRMNVEFEQLPASNIAVARPAAVVPTKMEREAARLATIRERRWRSGDAAQ